MKNRIYLSFTLVFFIMACADWPPAVTNISKIKALPSNTKAIRGIGIKDDEVAIIAQRFTELEYIFLNSDSKITNSSIENMIKLDKLSQVVIENASLITDDGLRHFQSFPSLKELIIYSGDQITIHGLQHLAKLNKLCLLNIVNWRNIKQSDLIILQKSLPNCEINYEKA